MGSYRSVAGQIKTLINLAIDVAVRVSCRRAEGPRAEKIKRGLLVVQILDDQTAELLRMTPEAPRKQNHPLKSLALPTPRRAQDVLHTRLRSKTRWQPSVQPVSFAHSLTQSWQRMAGWLFFLFFF